MTTSKARAERRAKLNGGGYGYGNNTAKPAEGSQAKVNTFMVPKPVGITRTSQMYPNNYYIDFDLSTLRAACDQVMKMGQTVNYATAVSWAYESSAFVQSLFEAIGNAHLNEPYYLMDDNGVINKAWTKEICDKKWFKELRLEILYTYFWGFSGLNFDPINNQLYKYPMQQLDPINRLLRENTYNYTEGVFFDKTDNLLFVQPSTSYERFLGWMQPITRQFIYMNLNSNNWVQAGKRLAFPFMSVGYPIGDGEIKDGLYQQNPLRADAENYAMNLDPSKALVTPYTLDTDGKARLSIITEIHESNVRGGLHKIFQDFNTDAKIELLQLTLGGTLTADPGKFGTHGLGDIHEDKLKTVISAKGEFVLSTLNDRNDFRKKIKKFYKNFPDSLSFNINRDKKLGIFEITALSNAIVASGNELLPEFFVNYGIRPQDIRRAEEPKQTINDRFSNKERKNRDQMSLSQLMEMTNGNH